MTGVASMTGVRSSTVLSMPLSNTGLAVGGAGAGTTAHQEIRGGDATHVGGLWTVVDERVNFGGGAERGGSRVT